MHGFGKVLAQTVMRKGIMLTTRERKRINPGYPGPNEQTGLKSSLILDEKS